ncbi:VCBS domain-containing protein [Bradyrhizobium sp.]|uniref:VCBS domain-containing protein n=1 Tax=Bradyrhizobium sp. TaxID=376 RepID=UPI0025C72D8C|nr:VCBS domain-containing protein [Bradyrhizobium sp.]
MSLAGKFTDLLSDGQGAQPLGSLNIGSVSTHAPAGAIIVPDAQLLFSGDFKRSGVDLILSRNGRELVLEDYFKGEKRATLASPDGAHLTGEIVNALTGHTQFAQADGSASVAPQMIGHVSKLAGSATAVRNGVSIMLNQGDTVHKGDVVQAGSDSTLGITFIDGTVFGLASNARMVLNEMIYDPNGSDNKSLLSLVQGTISFVAGATAKKGDMKVDTPVATMGIRGTAVLVEIDFEVPGQGGAPPAKFQVLVEPDGTTGSYILYDKTTLTPIATVNRAGTQTIINGQGGVSFQSSVQLSPDAQKIITDVFSLKFSDLNNPNTKQTNNFTDTVVPENMLVKLAGGDIVPVTVQLVSVPDGFVSAASQGPPTTRDRIPGPPSADASGGALAEVLDTTGSAALNTASGGVSYLSLNQGDVPSVSAAFSSFTYQDAAQADLTASLTAEQLAAIAAVDVPLSVIQDPAGKNVGTATWTYSVPDGAFDFLAVGETLVLTYLARVDNNFAPNNETTFIPLTITITGTNDKPTISATGGQITEQIDSTGNPDIHTVTGTVVFTDPDLTDRPVVSAAISTVDPFRYYDAEGNDVTLTLTAAQKAAIGALQVPLTVVQAATNTHDGVATWTYSIADSAFDFIAKGETLILNYVAQVDDGHGGVISTPITVSIEGDDVEVIGTNDIPTIAATSAAFAELSNENQPNPTGSTDLDTVSGTISFTDADLTDRPVVSAAFTSYTYLSAADVSFTLTAGQLDAVDAPLTVVQAPGNTNNGSASWTYSVADSAFDFLADGEILTLTYTATVDDGHGGIVTKPFTVEITGSNDTPFISSSPQVGTITEIADTQGALTPDIADGAITFTDADWTDTHAVKILNSVSASGTVAGLASGAVQLTWLSLGVLTDSTNRASGSQAWAFSASDSWFDYLADGEAVTLTYTVEIDDNLGGVAPQDVAVTVNGSNDAPIVDAIGPLNLIERTDAAALTALVAVTFTDLDLTDVGHTAAITHAAATDKTVGLALSEAQLIALLSVGTPSKTSGSSAGSLNLSFSAASTVFDYLAKDEKLTLTYTLAVNDHDGGVTEKTFVVTITGTNDYPVVASADVTGAVTEQVAPADLTDNGTIALSDVDLTDTHSISPTVTASAGALGSLSASVDPDTVNGVGGVINWTYSVEGSEVEYLAKNQTKVEQFTITVGDGKGGTVDRTVAVTITGTNDAPVIDAIAPQVFDEEADSEPLTATIAVTFTDLDLTDTGHAATITGVALDGDIDGLGLTDEDLIALVTAGAVTKDSGLSDGSVDLDFSAASTAFDYLSEDESVSLTYTVEIDDGDGGITPRTFTVTIEGTNDAPVLTAATPTLPTITEDDAENTGQTVASLLGTSMSDVDHGALEGIAITATTGSHGHWEYSTDGNNFIDFPELPTGFALLLAATDKVRFVPDGQDGGTDTLTYVAWDQTTGVPGTTADVSASGGSTAFSVSSDTATLTVTAINDAPTFTIRTDQFVVTEYGDAGEVTVSGLYLSAANETAAFDMTVTTADPASSVAPADGGDLDDLDFEDISETLDNGFTYDPGDDPQPETDRVTLTVEDDLGGTDTVNFIFRQAGEGPLTLIGTDDKDVIFASGDDDTLTGGASADQFVFTPEYDSSSADEITDFKLLGADRIDLRAYSEFVHNGNIDDWLPAHASQVELDVVITLDNQDSITLRNFAVANLQASDFIVANLV